MDDMAETDWDAALQHLNDSDDASATTMAFNERRCVALAADWMRLVDSNEGSPRAEAHGENETFAQVAALIGRGIRLAFYGVWCEGGDELVEELEQIRIATRQELRNT